MRQKNLSMQIIHNAHLITSVYSGVLAIGFTIIVDHFLDFLGAHLIPTLWSVILAFVVATIFGAMFGNKIVRIEKHYASQSFCWGVLMVIVALPVYALGISILMHFHHEISFTDRPMEELFRLYGIVLYYSLILVAWWLPLVGGVAAMSLYSLVQKLILKHE